MMWSDQKESYQRNRLARSRWAACHRLFKVRDGSITFGDPGWYKHPPGTVAYKLT